MPFDFEALTMRVGCWTLLQRLETVPVARAFDHLECSEGCGLDHPRLGRRRSWVYFRRVILKESSASQRPVMSKYVGYNPSYTASMQCKVAGACNTGVCLGREE